MGKRALIVYGGWDGHTPKESAGVCEQMLKGSGWDVVVKDTMDVYADAAFMAGVDVIVPIWTMGTIAKEQWAGLKEAVRGGCGLAGFHGGIIDSFRDNTEYQWMTGGQWVAHPGNCIPEGYDVYVSDPLHPITAGITKFRLPNTEQYYVHVDPAITVLCTTRFEFEGVDAGYEGLYQRGTVMPYAWTKPWGKGKVFVACWGHTYKDFDVPEAKEIVRRGIEWAAR